MAKPYAKLRGALAGNDCTHEYAARRLLTSKVSMSRKMNAHIDWTLSEMYGLMNLLNIPHSQMAEMFPENGGIMLNAKAKKTKSPA